MAEGRNLHFDCKRIDAASESPVLYDSANTTSIALPVFKSTHLFSASLVYLSHLGLHLRPGFVALAFRDPLFHGARHHLFGLGLGGLVRLGGGREALQMGS